ncbi:hypothetical protein [Legionella nagasakiensis]|nr:hypothetical protein [Legionella nagasakiensis]
MKKNKTKKIKEHPEIEDIKNICDIIQKAEKNSHPKKQKIAPKPGKNLS